MKSKNLQQSLMQEILSSQQPELTSIDFQSRFKKQIKSYPYSSTNQESLPRQSFNKQRSLSSSFLQITNQLVQSYTNKNTQKQEHGGKSRRQKMKTEMIESQFVAPMNYSAIYTKRSSIDQSLYEKGIREDSTRKLWVNKRQKQKQSIQLSQCSYMPIINETSKQIMSRLDKKQFIDRIKKKKEQMTKKIQSQALQKQMRECSFTPIINKSSNYLVIKPRVEKFVISDESTIMNHHHYDRNTGKSKMTYENNCVSVKQPSITKELAKFSRFQKSVSKNEGSQMTTNTVNHSKTNSQKRRVFENSHKQQSHSVSVFDYLYQDYVERQVKAKDKEVLYMKQCNKKPIINEISKQITQNTKFEERMLRYEQKKLEKEILKKQKQNIEMRKSYRPSINVQSHQRQIQRSIGEHLYMLAKQQRPKNYCEQNKTVKVNKKSEKVYEQRKSIVFEQLFRFLDNDQDGVITSHNICFDNLPHQIIKIIYPLIEELQVMEVELHQHQFIHSISNLFKTLTIHQKNTLLGFVGGPVRQEQSNNNFQPKINSKSKVIATYNKRSQMNIYEYCSIKQAEKEKFLESQRIQKSKKQLEDCTFQPKVVIKVKR